MAGSELSTTWRYFTSWEVVPSFRVVLKVKVWGIPAMVCVLVVFACWAAWSWDSCKVSWAILAWRSEIDMVWAETEDAKNKPNDMMMMESLEVSLVCFWDMGVG